MHRIIRDQRKPKIKIRKPEEKKQLTAQRKEMDMYPEYYGVNTGVPKTGIAAAFNKVLNNPLSQAIGFAMNPVNYNIMFLSKITFQQCFIKVFDKTQ